MKARLAPAPVAKVTPAPIPAADCGAAEALLNAILNTPALLDRLLNHPAVTARMETILEDYEFEVDVDADVNRLCDPRFKAITDITTRLNVRLTAAEAGKPKPPSKAKPAPGELPLG